MKKLLLAVLAMFTAFSSSGVQAFASEKTELKDHEIPHVVIDAQGMTLEELQESKTNTRAATDEYYQLVSSSPISADHIYSHTEVFSKYFNKGSNAILKQLIKGAVSGSATAAILIPVYTTAYFTFSVTGLYNQEAKYYYKYYNATYKITDALGNVLRTQTYNNLKISSKVEYKYDLVNTI